MIGAPLSLEMLEDPPALDLDEVKTRAARVVSPRTGIVSKLELQETGPCDPSVYWASARYADTTPIFGVRARNDGNASALDADTATIKAVGESIERYCAASWEADRLRLAPHADLTERAIAPESWALFSAAQSAEATFPVVPFGAQTPIRWAPGFSMARDRPVLVPAAFTYIPYVPGEGEAKIVPWQVSTGLACHTSLARASLKALLEVVERDAFMLFWHRQIRCPEIELAGIADRRIRELLDRTELLGYRRVVRLLTRDVPLPVVLVVFTSETHKPFAAMGCAADPDPGTALRLALEEALLSLHGITTITDRDPLYRPTAPDYLDIGDLLRHAWVYGVDPALKPVLARQLEPAGTVPFAALPRVPADTTLSRLRWLVRTLAAHDLEAIVVDLTTPDIDDVGFKVVRALVPGMQPLDVDHRLPHLGGWRIGAPERALAIPAGCAGPGLNRYPHPFP